MDEQGGMTTKVEGLRSTKLTPFGTHYYGDKPFIGLDAPQRMDAEVMPRLTEKAVSWIAGLKAGQPF